MISEKSNKTSNTKMLTKLMFRLLPVQILLGAVCNVNGIVSSFFASNYVGIEAMSAVGLYSPINMLITAISLLLVGGSSILCGKALGKNEQDTLHKVFSLDLVLAFFTGALFAALFIAGGMFDLTGFFTRDETVRLILAHTAH